jgi:23S rRNA (uracil1939-C5)-methyltransferase
VILMITSYQEEAIHGLLNFIQSNFEEVTSLNYVVNNKANDTFFDLPVHTFSGNPFIREKLGSLVLHLGPKSFYQTNSEGASILFDIVDRLADVKPHETVLDLYTGIGAIALYLASKANAVIGIEAVEEAVAFARSNAERNNIGNATFYAGNMQDLLPQTLTDLDKKPEVLITDPPREGMHPNVVQKIIEASPSRIVYVSCNPATQARDLGILQEKYKVIETQPVDLFPHTYHVENVVLLKRKT